MRKNGSYWLFSGIVLFFGFITGFSIGIFILPIGLALVVLGPVRDRPKLYWPLLMAVAGFMLGYVLFVPLYCSAAARTPGGSTETVCGSILGPEYHAPNTENPPNDLALRVGAVVGVVGAVVAFGGVSLAQNRRRSRDEASPK